MRSALFFSIAACAVVACSTASAPNIDGAPVASSDAGREGAHAETSSPVRPIMPYPSGPFGSAIGDTLADFQVAGYATSRSQRDIASLPFRDVTLGEVRGDSKCTCLVVIWSTAGLTCWPSIEGRNTIAAEMTRDESLCAIDVIWDTLDSGPPQIVGDTLIPDPATRADLDAVGQGLRPPFPITLATDDAVRALGTNAVHALPIFFIVRAADMTIADVVVANNLPGQIHAACASPRPRVEVLARGIAPTALLLDEARAFVADAGGHILSIPRGGGLPETLADLAAPGPVDTFAQDAANVYWSESTALARASKSGGGRVALTTLAAPATSIAVDGANVFLTHANGTIGSVPLAGGSETILVTGEASPASLLVDDARIYWLSLASNDVFAAAKDGTAKSTLLPASSRKRAQILFVGDRVAAREQGNYTSGSSFTTVQRSGGEIESYDQDYGLHTAASFDAAAARIDIVWRAADPSRGNDASILSVPTTPDAEGSRKIMISTLGQHAVNGLASGGDGYVYWTTNEPAGGSLRRIKR